LGGNTGVILFVYKHMYRQIFLHVLSLPEIRTLVVL